MKKAMNFGALGAAVIWLLSTVKSELHQVFQQHVTINMQYIIMNAFTTLPVVILCIAIGISLFQILRNRPFAYAKPVYAVTGILLCFRLVMYGLIFCQSWQSLLAYVHQKSDYAVILSISFAGTMVFALFVMFTQILFAAQYVFGFAALKNRLPSLLIGGTIGQIILNILYMGLYILSQDGALIQLIKLIPTILSGQICPLLAMLGLLYLEKSKSVHTGMFSGSATDVAE